MSNARTAITEETRRESYDDILKKLSGRQQQCLTGLAELGGSATANELARYLVFRGDVQEYSTNYTNPRLIELSQLNLVSVIGKRRDSKTNKSVAIYQLKGSEV